MIVVSYGLLYVATTKSVICDGDCSKMFVFDTTLRHGRSYVVGAYRCTSGRISDTICVNVKDTTGINWSLLVDTACLVAGQVGLAHQTIFIFKPATATVDTVAKKSCP